MAITTPIGLTEDFRLNHSKYLGRHVLAEFFECDPNVLNNPTLVEQYMLEAALECGATVVQKCFHLFNPHGVSGVVIISESHLAIHTWPELGYAAVDLFTCGEQCDPKVAYEFLKKRFNSKDASYSQLNRGILDDKNLSVEHTPFYVSAQG
ncbi:MAG: adenosylmethionine decarboxylase [Candidatus Gastranaerophilales bacterium]|nr:adenosylmethionine decarboxylase [Candidatus Gastranaerophilales bacterium]